MPTNGKQGLNEMDAAWAGYSEQVHRGWTTMLDGVHYGLDHEEALGTRAALDTVRFERLLPATMANGISTSHHLQRYEPHRLLQFSWGEEQGASPSEVTFELQPDGDQTRLIVTHRLLGRDVIANVAGGWHTHLAVLGDRLAGVEPRPFWGLFEAVEEAYKDRFYSE